MSLSSSSFVHFPIFIVECTASRRHIAIDQNLETVKHPIADVPTLWITEEGTPRCSIAERIVSVYEFRISHLHDSIRLLSPFDSFVIRLIKYGISNNAEWKWNSFYGHFECEFCRAQVNCQLMTKVNTFSLKINWVMQKLLFFQSLAKDSCAWRPPHKQIRMSCAPQIPKTSSRYVLSPVSHSSERRSCNLHLKHRRTSLCIRQSLLSLLFHWLSFIYPFMRHTHARRRRFNGTYSSI